MKPNVMVVDDVFYIRMAVMAVLAKHGFDTVGAESGEAALTAIAEGFRGVVFLDVIMPGLDGWQTLREMQARNLSDGVVVCMFTTLDDSAEEAGANFPGLGLRCLKKPFQNQELVAMARECLAQLGTGADAASAAPETSGSK